MPWAGLADDHRLRREGYGREGRQCEGRKDPRPAVRSAPETVRQRRKAVRQRRTGFEPFLIAAVLGLGIWALILLPFFL